MITLVILAVLAVLLAIVLRQLFRKPLPRPADSPTVKLTDARVGDVVSIPGAAVDLDDVDFTVERRNLYEVGPRRWIELRGQFRGRPTELYAWEGDGQEAALVPHTATFTLADLGLSEDDLAQIDQRQNSDDNFPYDGKHWRYRFSREFVLFRDSGSQGGSFYGWLFEEEGGKWVMLIRKGEGEPFAASAAKKLDPADVTVYRAS